MNRLLASYIKELDEKILKSSDNTYDEMMHIDSKDRDNVWKSACGAFSKDTFGPGSSVNVVFTGNYGQSSQTLDANTEFFCILMDAIRHMSNIFSGPTDCRYLKFNRKGKHPN